MIWYKKLYLGESIKRARWIRYKIAYGRKAPEYYCIALAEAEGSLLDIYPSRLLRMPGFDGDNMQIVGLARDKKEAFEVVRRIIEDVYLHTHGFDLKAYLNI